MRLGSLLMHNPQKTLLIEGLNGIESFSKLFFLAHSDTVKDFSCHSSHTGAANDADYTKNGYVAQLNGTRENVNASIVFRSIQICIRSFLLINIESTLKIEET